MSVLYFHISLLILLIFQFPFGYSLNSSHLKGQNQYQVRSNGARSSHPTGLNPRNPELYGSPCFGSVCYTYNSRFVNSGKDPSSCSRGLYCNNGSSISKNKFSPSQSKPGSLRSTSGGSASHKSPYYRYYLESIGGAAGIQQNSHSSIYEQKHSIHLPSHPHQTPLYKNYLESVGKLQSYGTKEKQSLRPQHGHATTTKTSHFEQSSTSGSVKPTEQPRNVTSHVEGPAEDNQLFSSVDKLSKEDYQSFSRINRCCILIQDLVDVALVAISNMTKTWTGNSELLEQMLIQATTAFSILYSSLSSCKTKLLSFDPSNEFALSKINGPYIDEEAVKHSEKDLDIVDEKQYKIILRSIRKTSFKIQENSTLMAKVINLKHIDQQCKEFGLSSSRRALVNILQLYSKILGEELDKAQLAADIYAANEIFDESTQADFDKYVLNISDESD
ncbi:uncharacterized protein ELE39_003598 [Cryptosporidium sp. chipmunk genotype I]|uniref:uncharacterized protein n=1 Tax=Cryptosporidium sp. chipmunk genotype I TaxID=1280935 RepID=UPI00351AAC50|nr:hypothetical protein ELE39_003598 [Cryptosporidium sp. chipmunk genotype I]